jgi:hypothetical protein
MKKQIITFSALLFTLALSVQQIVSNPTGAPLQASGGPAEGGATCSQSGCHSGTPTTVTNIITTDIPAEGYTPGTTYNITVTVTGSGWKGFMMSAQDAAGNFRGTLLAGTGSKVVFTNYITHSSDKSSSPAIWTFKWTAPTAGSGSVNLYGAFAVTRNATRKQMVTIQEKVNANVPIFKSPTASNITVSGASFADSVNAQGLSYTTGFQYKTASGSWMTIAAVPSTVNATTYTAITGTASGLTPATAYTLRSFAFNGTDTFYSPAATFTTLSATGLMESGSIMEASVFPNPAGERLTVSYSLSQSEYVSVRLVNIDGKVSKEWGQQFYTAGNHEQQVDVSEITTGIYFLQISSASGSYTRKIWIQ